MKDNSTNKWNQAAQLKKFREQLGLTQQQVADYLDIKREMVSYYETGERDIPIGQLQSLANLFAVELIDLLENDPLVSQANVAFAFKAQQLGTEDLKQIANFRKVIKNYLKLKMKTHS